jgi:cell division protein FtsZ
MDEMGKAMMGTGEATGERRAIEAAEAAINNPLLDDVSLKGAKGVLINITGGRDLTLYEVDEAASLIRGQVDEDANIIVGSALDNDLDGIVRVSVVATGVESEYRMETQSPAAAEEIETIALEDEYEEDEFAIEDEYEEDVAAFAPQPEPAYVAPKPYPPKVVRPQAQQQVPQPQYQPQAAPIPQAAPTTVVKKPFGFFGLKKPKPIAAQPVQQVAPQPTGDLFGDGADEELEIPSFLRRQNR